MRPDQLRLRSTASQKDPKVREASHTHWINPIRPLSGSKPMVWVPIPARHSPSRSIINDPSSWWHTTMYTVRMYVSRSWGPGRWGLEQPPCSRHLTPKGYSQNHQLDLDLALCFGGDQRRKRVICRVTYFTCQCPRISQ